MIEQSQTVYVSVAHRYWNSQWSEARNRQIYGREASQEGVGSNLALTITVESDTTDELNLDAPLQMLKGLCDHRCFFTDIPEFENKPSTLETISVYLGEKLFSWPMSEGVHVKQLTVTENPRLSCTVKAPLQLQQGAPVVSLSEKHFNLLCTVQAPLDLESGIALARGVIGQAIREVGPSFSEPASDPEAWGQALFAALQGKVKALCELNIDLGSHQSLRISSYT